MVLQYQKLDFSRFETRLLDIEPLQDPSNSQLVQCRLEHASLLQLPEYDALSYCWGDPTTTNAIIVNGEITEVTVNLELALRELRRRNVKKVWVDALCINQGDFYERSNQVLQMGHIYSTASKVLAWLGPVGSGSSEGFNVIKALASGVHITSMSPDTLRPILERDFWRRIWIVQEIAKAKTIELICGESSLSFDVFTAAFRKGVLQAFLTPEQLELLAGLDEFRTREQQSHSMPLYMALIRSTRCLASHPRDKIYALLGLTSDGTKIVPLPNYSQPTAEVSYNATHKMMAAQKRISLILVARRSFSDPASDVLPSWQPNWLGMSEAIPPWVIKCTENSALNIDVQINLTDQVMRIPCKFYQKIEMVMRTHSDSPEMDSTDECGKLNMPYSSKKALLIAIFHALTWFGFEKSETKPKETDRHESPFGNRRSVIADGVEFYQEEREETKKLLVFAALCLEKGRSAPDSLRRWMQCNRTMELNKSRSLEEVLIKFHKDNKFMARRLDLHDRRSNDVYKALDDGVRYYELYDMRVGFFRRTSGLEHEPGLYHSHFVRPMYKKAQVGDQICFLPNCSLPVILRADGDLFRYIGEMYFWATGDEKRRDVIGMNFKQNVTIY